MSDYDDIERREDALQLSKKSEEKKTTDNSTLLWKLRRKAELKCPYCKPNRGENAGRQPRPDKHKNRRRV
jgi:hypothetical protein